MAVTSEYVSRGKVLRSEGDSIVFAPANTTYELRLDGPAYGGSTNQPLGVVIHAVGRKVMTVPSGGNWVQPIFGPPRVIQGRVRALDEQTIVVQAGAMFHIRLPAEATAIDLNAGPIQVGSMVNATILPGASYEPAAG